MKLFILLALLIPSLYGAPAFSTKRQYTQPDGTTFNARIRGDEYLHWIETDDEEIVLYNKAKKRFEYAIIKDDRLQPSGETLKAADGAKRAPRLHPKPSKKELQILWKENRQKAAKRRNKSKND